MKYSKFFEDELTLENLSRHQLQAMCRVLDLPPMGMDSFLRFSLRMKLKRLKMDDNVSICVNVRHLIMDEENLLQSNLNCKLCFDKLLKGGEYNFFISSVVDKLWMVEIRVLGLSFSKGLDIMKLVKFENKTH